MGALEPVFDKLVTALALVAGPDSGGASSAAHALLDAWLLPLRAASDQERRRVYLRCVFLAERGADVVPYWDRGAFLRLLLDRVAGDREASAEVVADVLEAVCRLDLLPFTDISAVLLSCVHRVLGVDLRVDRRLVAVVEAAARIPLPPHESPLDEVAAEIAVRLHETGVETIPIGAALLNDVDLRYGERRPDLVRRLVPLVEDPPNLTPKLRQHVVGDTPEADS